MQIAKIASKISASIGVFLNQLKYAYSCYIRRVCAAHYKHKPPENEWIITPDGMRACFRNRIIHREDGPALVYPDGKEAWLLNDKFHRLDGPAIINPSHLLWYIDGEPKNTGPSDPYYPQIKTWFNSSGLPLDTTVVENWIEEIGLKSWDEGWTNFEVMMFRLRF